MGTQTWHRQWKKVVVAQGAKAALPAITSVDQIEIIPVLRQGEYGLSRQTLKDRAREMGALTSEEAFDAVSALAKQFPPEWNCATIVFPEAAWKDGEGAEEAISTLWRTPDGTISKKSSNRDVRSIGTWHRHLLHIKHLRGMAHDFYQRMHFVRVRQS